MTTYELKNLMSELTNIEQPWIMRTDEEDMKARKRVKTICRKLRVKYAEDAFDKYGRYGCKIQ